MTKYKVDHDRPTCIGCAACAAIYPENWEMDADGLANVLNTDIGTEKDRDVEAAESCPVNCIHIVQISDDGSESRLI